MQAQSGDQAQQWVFNYLHWVEIEINGVWILDELHPDIGINIQADEIA